ncbi:MAG: hypothetical protein ACFCU5_03210 [Pleurocapsa sp.]
MKKQLSYALLTLSLISINILPAKAVDDILKANQSQRQEYSSNQFCVWFPHIGEICFDL